MSAETIIARGAMVADMSLLERIPPSGRNGSSATRRRS
jgi:hypothetical protein